MLADVAVVLLGRAKCEGHVRTLTCSLSGCQNCYFVLCKWVNNVNDEVGKFTVFCDGCQRPS